MTCKICSSSTSKLFNTKLLKKYDVDYFKCNSCGFIQTEKPYWLEEAYSSAITNEDLGLIYRNEIIKPIIKSLAFSLHKGNGKYIDYGGGYGMLVRMMRDLGLDFYRQDLYCENIFAKHFDVDELKINDNNFSMLTTFEVFEHLENPMEEIEKMLQYSKTIFFSTLLVPANSKNLNDWWYYLPETGQHIAFYTKPALEYIAKKYNLNLYTNGVNLHLLTNKKVSPLTFKLLTKFRISKLYNKFFTTNKSLLMSDFESIRKK